MNAIESHITMSSRTSTNLADEDTLSNTKRSFESIQKWFRKRKRTSPSPSPSPSPSLQSLTSKSASKSINSTGKSRKIERDAASGSRPSQESQQSTRIECPALAMEGTITNHTQSMQQSITSLQADQFQRVWVPDQMSGVASDRKAARPGRRRSSTASSRLREIFPPRYYTSGDLENALILSQPDFPGLIGRVSQPHPEPGWRVATKPRSRESCFTTSLPLYSARHHSPLATGEPFTIYFEGQIRRGNSEDVPWLALGFVAERDEALCMPGVERGGIGIHCYKGMLYINGKPAENLGTAGFDTAQRVGIGLTMSRRDSRSQQVDDAQATSTPSSSINVEVFLSRDGEGVGAWSINNLSTQSDSILLEGLNGSHDLYAAVGTKREVNVDIFFKEHRKYWRYGAMKDYYGRENAVYPRELST